MSKVSLQYLIEANHKGEGITTFFMQCSFGFFLSTVVLGLILISYCFIKYGHFNQEYLFLPYNYVCVIKKKMSS